MSAFDYGLLHKKNFSGLICVIGRALSLNRGFFRIFSFCSILVGFFSWQEGHLTTLTFQLPSEDQIYRKVTWIGFFFTEIDRHTQG